MIDANCNRMKFAIVGELEQSDGADAPVVITAFLLVMEHCLGIGDATSLSEVAAILDKEGRWGCFFQSCHPLVITASLCRFLEVVNPLWRCGNGRRVGASELLICKAAVAEPVIEEPDIAARRDVGPKLPVPLVVVDHILDVDALLRVPSERGSSLLFHEPLLGPPKKAILVGCELLQDHLSLDKTDRVEDAEGGVALVGRDMLKVWRVLGRRTIGIVRVAGEVVELPLLLEAQETRKSWLDAKNIKE